MNDDIVARLRVLNHHAKKLAENESLSDLHLDAFRRCEDLTWLAADDIERLRNDLDGSRLAYRGASYDRDRMRAEIERLRKERDAARREVCRIYPNPGVSVFLLAERRGWDCYKENP
jgi:hypothetical protein